MNKVSRRDFGKLCLTSAVALSAGAGLRPAPAAAAATRGRGRLAAAPFSRELESDLLLRLQAGGGTDPLAAHTVQIADNMEPVIPHEDQATAAAKKLAALEK